MTRVTIVDATPDDPPYPNGWLVVRGRRSLWSMPGSPAASAPTPPASPGGPPRGAQLV